MTSTYSQSPLGQQASGLDYKCVIAHLGPACMAGFRVQGSSRLGSVPGMACLWVFGATQGLVVPPPTLSLSLGDTHRK